MANGVEVGTAYVSVTADVKGLEKGIKDALLGSSKHADIGGRNITSQLTTHGRAAGRGFGDEFNKGLQKGINDAVNRASGSFGPLSGAASSALSSITSKAGLTALGVAGIGVAAVGIVKQFYDLGATWDKISDTITGRTGAMGKDLKGIVDIVKQVGDQSAVSLQGIGDLASGVKSSLHLSGQAAATLTQALADIQQITGQIVDTRELGKVFRLFDVKDIAAQKQAVVDLLAASQATQIPINELSTSLATTGKAGKEAGLGLQETLSVLLALNESGVSFEKAGPALTFALRTWSNQGKDATTELSKVIEQVHALIAAGNESAAQKLAFATFGKGANDLFQAIKDGTLNVKTLTSALEGLNAPADLIDKLKKSTEDADSSWAKLTHTLSDVFSPVADTVFGNVNDFLTKMIGLTDLVAEGFRGVGSSIEQADRAKGRFGQTFQSGLGATYGGGADVGAGGGSGPHQFPVQRAGPPPPGFGTGLGVPFSVAGEGGLFTVPEARGSGAAGPQIPFPAEYGMGPRPGESVEDWQRRNDAIEAAHDVAEKQASLDKLTASNTATESELINARNDLATAENRQLEQRLQQQKQQREQIQVPYSAEYSAAPLPGETAQQYSARGDILESHQKTVEAQAQLNQLMQDGTTTTDDLVKARNDLAKAERAEYETQLRLRDATDKASDALGFQGGGIIDFLIWLAFKPLREQQAAQAAQAAPTFTAPTAAQTFTAPTAGQSNFSDAALLANVPSGQYLQTQAADLTQGIGDCSSAVEDLINLMDGVSTAGRSLSTGNAPQWLADHGFLPTASPVPGAFNVGFNSGHMQATLPGGTPFNWGSGTAAAGRGIGGSGAFGSGLTSHYYRPVGGVGGGANWDATAQGESGGNWATNTGNGFYGGLQFAQSSWELAGGTQYATRADLATPQQQKMVADNLLRIQGPGAWPNTFVPGYGSGGAVPIIAHKGEHVLTASDVSAMGGQGGVYSFRNALHMDKGGAVDSDVLKRLKDYMAGGSKPAADPGTPGPPGKPAEKAPPDLTAPHGGTGLPPGLEPHGGTGLPPGPTPHGGTGLLPGPKSPYPEQQPPQATQTSGRTGGYIPAAAGSTGVAGTSFAAGILNLGAETINSIIDQAGQAAVTAISMAATMGAGAGSFGAGAAAGPAAGAGAQFLVGMATSAAKRGVSWGFQMGAIGIDALTEQLFPFGAPRWLGYDYTGFMPNIQIPAIGATTAEKAALAGAKAEGQPVPGQQQPGGPVQPGMMSGQQQGLLPPSMKPFGMSNPAPTKPPMPEEGPGSALAPGAAKPTVGPAPAPTPSTSPAPTQPQQTPMDWLKNSGLFGFDQGGWMQPGQAGINLTNRPEPVLTPQQWEAISNNTEPGNGGFGVHIQNLYTQDAEAASREIESRRRLAMMQYSGRP